MERRYLFQVSLVHVGQCFRHISQNAIRCSWARTKRLIVWNMFCKQTSSNINYCALASKPSLPFFNEAKELVQWTNKAVEISATVILCMHSFVSRELRDMFRRHFIYLVGLIYCSDLYFYLFCPMPNLACYYFPSGFRWVANEVKYIFHTDGPAHCAMRLLQIAANTCIW